MRARRWRNDPIRAFSAQCIGLLRTDRPFWPHGTLPFYKRLRLRLLPRTTNKTSLSLSLSLCNFFSWVLCGMMIVLLISISRKSHTWDRDTLFWIFVVLLFNRLPGIDDLGSFDLVLSFLMAVCLGNRVRGCRAFFMGEQGTLSSLLTWAGWVGWFEFLIPVWLTESTQLE